ncbi:hypothetical protein PIB30_085865 [Stylosanthes scabra]|uniref:Uncharacterized protein n=1 Tax=Stylosanthes scabra TaxID=79078 RepID=A0ABU6TVT8_9FABA|nr:hypothetical protein [Stylosanthes scabra]
MVTPMIKKLTTSSDGRRSATFRALAGDCLSRCRPIHCILYLTSFTLVLAICSCPPRRTRRSVSVVNQLLPMAYPGGGEVLVPYRFHTGSCMRCMFPELESLEERRVQHLVEPNNQQELGEAAATMVNRLLSSVQPAVAAGALSRNNTVRVIFRDYRMRDIEFHVRMNVDCNVIHLSRVLQTMLHRAQYPYSDMDTKI